MALLDVAVLVGVVGLDRLAGQAIVPQQALVALRERRRPFGPRRDCRCQAIGAMQLRHATQFPQGVLQALAETLVALGEAHRARLPVRVREHEMVNQVLKGRPVDGHLQRGAMREVAGAQPPGMMQLREKHFLRRPFQGTPLFETPLQGAQLTVGETAGKPSLQIIEQGLGLQAGVKPQLFLQLGPDVGKGVGPCAVVSVHATHLTGQFAETAVLTCRLGIETGLVGGTLLGQSLVIESSQSSHLLISDHPEPPVTVGSE
jgi:hypothetical protein